MHCSMLYFNIYPEPPVCLAIDSSSEKIGGGGLSFTLSDEFVAWPTLTTISQVKKRKSWQRSPINSNAMVFGITCKNSNQDPVFE